jgi:hypothetical protein
MIDEKHEMYGRCLVCCESLDPLGDGERPSPYPIYLWLRQCSTCDAQGLCRPIGDREWGY